MDRPQKITFVEMRDMGVRGLLLYCQDYKCSHSQAISADHWPDDLRLSDIEPSFVCRAACGKRGADVRPDFNWNRTTVGGMAIVDLPMRRRARREMKWDA
jgi:hypothetical protein